MFPKWAPQTETVSEEGARRHEPFLGELIDLFVIRFFSGSSEAASETGLLAVPDGGDTAVPSTRKVHY